MKRRILRLAALTLWAAQVLPAQEAPKPLLVPADSPRWVLEGGAKVADYLGRKALALNGGAAVLDGFELRDGVVDVDVATPASRGFFGIQFRITADGENAEWVYLRQHKSGQSDALQYTPVLHTGLNWQIFNGPGFTGAVDIPKGAWFHLRLEVTGAQARLFVGDMAKPALVIDDLKSGFEKGQVALAVLTGETYFSNFEVRATPAATWERHLPPMPEGTLARWSLSPAMDALARDLERPLAPAETAAMAWQAVEAEAPGFVLINRYRASPHPRVSFATDFAKRLEPQPGMQVVYARTEIVSEREQIRRLDLGYSDDVSVFLNGRILYRGRSAQNFRDPAFLGIVSPENDSVYLPLRQGRNELVLAVSELGGGWGFIGRLRDLDAGAPAGDLVAALVRQADQWDKDIVRKDAAAIAANMAEEFRQIASDGSVADKAAFLRDILSPELTIDPYTVEDFDVRIQGEGGDVAQLSGRTRMTGRYKGEPFTTHYRYIDTYVRRDGRWQVVSVQTTKVREAVGN